MDVERWKELSRGFRTQQPRAGPEGNGILGPGDCPLIPCWPPAAHRYDRLSLQITFYDLVKVIYTLGYSVSLISLTTGSIILCLFR